jgi:hypothetical protein
MATLVSLPAALSSFVGRTAELVEVAELLDRHRLIAVVGHQIRSNRSTA